MLGFVISMVCVGAFVYGFRKMWRVTSPEARHVRRVERAARRQDIEDEAHSRRQGRLSHASVYIEGQGHFTDETLERINEKGGQE